jgi:hypothetical protein
MFSHTFSRDPEKGPGYNGIVAPTLNLDRDLVLEAIVHLRSDLSERER